jgi:hypothetical protein
MFSDWTKAVHSFRNTANLYRETIVSFVYEGQQDAVISFTIARYCEHISLENEPFYYLDYCMIDCA